MTIFSDPNEICIGDSVFIEYDDKRAFGTVLNIDNNSKKRIFRIKVLNSKIQTRNI